MAAPESALLGTFQKHIEDMRSLVHCKICLKPFYEPFTLSCGHTYCYSCLSSWIGGSHQRQKNKNCPDCRTIITTEPCPNYTLRDLVHMFCNRAELLPEDETVQEHENGKAEEAQILAADRSARALFKGAFGQRLQPGPLGRPQFIRDDEDGGIWRCPRCTHEIVGGMCTNGSCGFGFEGVSDYSDEDIDSVTGEIIPHHHLPGAAPLPPGYSISSDDDGNSIPYLSEDEEEDDSEMNDFIDDDEDHDLPDEEDEEDGYGTESSLQPPRLIHFDGPRPHPGYVFPPPSEPATPTDYSDAPEHHYNHFSGDPQDNQSDGYESGHALESPTPSRTYEYNQPPTYDIDYDSPRHYNFSEVESETEAQTATDYDQDEEENDSVREVSPPVAGHHIRRPKRRILDSDDEDQDEEAETANEDTEGAQFSSEDEEEQGSDEGLEAALDDDSDNDSEESEDTAIRPPQSSLARRQRLKRQRQGRVQRQSSSAEPGAHYHGGGARRRGGGGGGAGDGSGRRLYPVVDLTGYTSGARSRGASTMRVY